MIGTQLGARGTIKINNYDQMHFQVETDINTVGMGYCSKF